VTSVSHKREAVSTSDKEQRSKLYNQILHTIALLKAYYNVQIEASPLQLLSVLRDVAGTQSLLEARGEADKEVRPQHIALNVVII
jgi:glucose-6-phosphate dehydrogenase assembly protein OpcA